MRLSRSRCRKACSASRRAGAPAHRPDHDPPPQAVLVGGPEGRPHPRESGAGERDPSGPCTSCAGAPNAKGRQRCRVSMRERLRLIRTGSRCCGRFSALPRCARASDRKRTRSWRAMKAVPSPGWRRASARPWCTSGGAPPTRERGYTISGWLARGGWLGPPVEVCPETELIAIEASATVCDDAFQIGEVLEVLVGERLIQNRPEVLSRLKVGRVRGQVGEPDALRHDQVRFGVPAGAVEPEHDDAIPSRPGLTGKQRQEPCEERLGHPLRDVPKGLARGRLDEGGGVQPLVPGLTQRDRPRTFGRPHPPDDRLQPEAVLVGGPDLDRLVRVLSARLSDGLLELFLNASRSSGVAAAGWRGRGFCTDQSIALSASQPRWGKTAASPSSLAIQAATFRLDHRPPSGGGWIKRARKRSRSPGLSTLGTPPLRRRRSPSASGPFAL